MRVKRRLAAVCLLPFSCGRTGLSFCASVLLFLLDVERLRWALSDGLGHVVGTIDWAGDRGSGKDIAGFLCSLKILTQWHWSLGRGRVWGVCMDVGTLGRVSSLRGGLLWMEMEARVGRVKSLFTMAALFQILFLVWGGLSFEKLADSGSPRPFLWSSRPHSPPVGDSNRTIRRAEACQGWTSSPVPAGRLRDLDVGS